MRKFLNKTKTFVDCNPGSCAGFFIMISMVAFFLALSPIEHRDYDKEIEKGYILNIVSVEGSCLVPTTGFTEAEMNENWERCKKASLASQQ